MAGKRPLPRKSFDRSRQRSQPSGPLRLFGLHTVRAALDNPRRVKHRLLATTNALARLTEEGPVGDVAVSETGPKDLDKLVGRDAVHQGVVLEADPLPRLEIGELPGTRLLVVLDQVTDPHNIGAILRTACAFGADAVITTARHAPQETAVLAKSASGALDLVNLVEVKNLGEAITGLRARGVWCVGFDSEAEDALAPATDDRDVAIVLGAEGKGLRHKTRELCDALVKLDVPGPIKSLNVSNAAAVALFAYMQR